MLTILATQTNFGNKTFQSCTNFETPKKCQKWTPKWCQNLTPKMGPKKWHPKRGPNFWTKNKSNHNSNLNALFGCHFLDPILAIKCQILAPFWGPFFGPHFGVLILVKIQKLCCQSSSARQRLLTCSRKEHLQSWPS